MVCYFMLKRTRHIKIILQRLGLYPVVGILGSRQVGKTTLARQVGAAWKKGPLHWYDLELESDAARLKDPVSELAGLKGLVVLDEIHHVPNIYKTLRVLADRPSKPARFLILGSAAPNLLRQSAESLAGRIHYHILEGFSRSEVRPSQHGQLWLRGGYPLAFLARNEADSFRLRAGLVRDYVQRDLPDLNFRIPAESIRRLWSMLAHYHGQTLNFSELGRAFGMSDNSVRGYCEVLSSTYMVRLLQPWHENLSKRQVKAPKVYLRDSGILHALLGIRDMEGLQDHPKVVASWEGFGLEEIVRKAEVNNDETYFWASHQGAELDLLLIHGRERVGFEFKHHSSPGLTASMSIAQKDLNLDKLWVVHPGVHRYKLGRNVEALPSTKITEAY